MIAWLTQTEGRAFGAYIVCAMIAVIIVGAWTGFWGGAIAGIPVAFMWHIAHARGRRVESDEWSEAMRQWDEAQRRTNGGAA